MNTDHTQNFTDCQLVEHFQTSGDKVYFGIIYQRYRERVYRCCLGILKDRDQAADLTHDVMVIVMTKLPQLRNGDLLSFWIYRISKYESLRALRVANRLRTENIDVRPDCPAQEDTLARCYSHEYELICLKQALNQLSRLDRNIIELKYFESASIIEVQGHTGLSASAVKMRLLRARVRLLSIIQQKNTGQIRYA